jgi:ribosome-associated protein
MKSIAGIERDFNSEFNFNATRSSGPGGQHVNKVSTKIELRFDVPGSRMLDEDEKKVILGKLARRITKEGILIVVAGSERSQYENKAAAIARFYRLIEKALAPVKKRTRTMPTRASKLKRMEYKQLLAKKKSLRKPSFDE